MTLDVWQYIGVGFALLIDIHKDLMTGDAKNRTCGCVVILHVAVLENWHQP